MLRNVHPQKVSDSGMSLEQERNRQRQHALGPPYRSRCPQPNERGSKESTGGFKHHNDLDRILDSCDVQRGVRVAHSAATRNAINRKRRLFVSQSHRGIHGNGAARDPVHLYRGLAIFGLCRNDCVSGALPQDSTERQYALRAMALEMGWSESSIRTLDRDLGMIGADMTRREDLRSSPFNGRFRKAPQRL
jgi:hypothetical protein